MGNERCKWEKTFGEIFCGKGKDNGWGGGERVKIIVRRRKFCVIRINKKKFKKSINAFFFSIYFGIIYILVFAFLFYQF